MEPQELLMRIMELKSDMAVVAARVNVLWMAFGASILAYSGHSVFKRGNNGYKDFSERVMNNVANKLLNGKKNGNG